VQGGGGQGRTVGPEAVPDALHGGGHSRGVQGIGIGTGFAEVVAPALAVPEPAGAEPAAGPFAEWGPVAAVVVTVAGASVGASPICADPDEV